MKKFETFSKLIREFESLVINQCAQNKDVTVSDFFSEGYEDYKDETDPSYKYDTFTNPIRDVVGRFELVHSDDYHENESCGFVYHFIDQEMYVYIGGYYTSYDGLSVEFDDNYQVEPQQVTRTEYRRI